MGPSTAGKEWDGHHLHKEQQLELHTEMCYLRMTFDKFSASLSHDVPRPQLPSFSDELRTAVRG